MIHPDRLFGRLGNRMFQMAYIYSQMKRGVITDIYVQNPVYFDYYRDDIKNLFGDGIGNMDKVAIHVRRAGNPLNKDEPKYCDNSFYVDLCKTDYYQKAMGLFPNEKFIVFSDDIEWCKKQEMFKNCSFSEGHTEIEDMNLMAGCKAIIMANSSFSWWAAYLSNGKIVAPKAWYADGITRTHLLKEWIVL